MQKSAVIALASCAVCAAAFAQQPSPTPVATITNKMPEMVVTAARLPGQEQPITKLPANASVITTEQIERSPAVSVPEMLQMQPGLQSIDTTGFGLFSTPNMRGFGERSGVLVLVDGVRVNDPGNSTANALWPSIPPQDIERIEIIRGGGSHVYGEGAIGGVINIITKKGTKEPSGEAELSAGNYGYWRGHAGGGGSFGPGRAYGSATYEEGDGHRDGMAFYKENARASVGVTTAWGDLDAGVYFHKDRMRNPGAQTYQQFHDNPEQVGSSGAVMFENEITRLTFDWSKTFDSGFSFHVKPYVQNFFEKLVSPATATFAESVGEVNQPSWGGTLQLDHVADVLGGQNRATLGGEWVRQDFMSVWKWGGAFPGSYRSMVDYDTFSFFLQDALDVTEKLRLQAGIRYDNRRYRLDIPDVTSFAGDRIAEIHDLDAWSPGGGAVYSFTKTENAYFNISRSFKLPIGNDIGTATQDFRPNSDIQPISSMNYEVGFRWDPWREFGGSLAVYHSEIENDIQVDPFSTVDLGGGFIIPWPQNQNFDETRNGIELGLHSSPTDWITLFLNYTLQESRFDGGLYDGNQIPQVPQHIISGGVIWTPIKWFSWSWEVLHARDQVPTNDLKSAFDRNDYTVVNTKLTWTPCKNARVYLAVNNVLDSLYENFPAATSPTTVNGPQRRGYNPAPGLAVQAGVGVKF